MDDRSRKACLAVYAAAMLTVATDALAQTPAAAATAAAAPASEASTNGTVMDATGNVMVRRGARSFAATRGTSLQPGDQIFLLDGATLTLGCAGQNAVKVTTVGTFTYSGCLPVAVAATPAEQTAAPVASTTEVPAPPALAPTTPEPVAAKKGGGGATLGIIGGLAALAALAGGGGGGGGSSGSSSSSSSSPPASP